MKSRTVTAPGSLVTIYAYDNVPSSSAKVAYKEVFSPSADAHGDHRRPTSHSFSRSRASGLKGDRWTTTVGNPFATYRQYGVLRNADLYPDYVHSGWEPRLYDEALSKLAEQVRGGVDLSIDGAQLGQTRAMLQAVTKFSAYALKFASDFKRHPLKTIGDKWLEYRYGWSPLLSTIYEIGHRMYDPDAWKYAFKVRVRDSLERRDIVGSFFVGGDEVAVRKIKMGCEMKVWLKPPSSATQDVARYTSLNPASIAWELMPFSFVVDWFINVGGYIRNLETALLYSSLFETGYVCYSLKVTSDHTVGGTGTSGSTKHVMNAHGSWEYISKQRVIMLEYPLPRRPVFQVDLGSGRLLNAAALLTTFLGHK